MSKNFEWSLSDRPPKLEDHSFAKLGVLRRYIRSYFERITSHLGMDHLKLDLVDGFCGGGIFDFNGTTVSGTPLIFLEEANRSNNIIRENRKKPVHFDMNFYFIDSNINHVEFLRREIWERNLNLPEWNIEFIHGRFDTHLRKVISSIQKHQPIAGRSLFLLDQCGYVDANASHADVIFNSLPKSEVILTFSIDSMINFLSEKREDHREIKEYGLTRQKIDVILDQKNTSNGNAVAQRIVRESVRRVSGAPFDTPFFIKPQKSRRALWFVHLSRHPTARDVMMRTHWEESNTFIHYGNADVEIMGWDAIIDGGPPLFEFGPHALIHFRSQLEKKLPQKIFVAIGENGIRVRDLHAILANESAARFEDIDFILVEMHRNYEIDICSSNGKIKSRMIHRVNRDDILFCSKTPMLPILNV